MLLQIVAATSPMRSTSPRLRADISFVVEDGKKLAKFELTQETEIKIYKMKVLDFHGIFTSDRRTSDDKDWDPQL